jgi:hypothetical protein
MSNKPFGNFTVEGDINPGGSRHVTQYPEEQLQEELHVLLSHPAVKGVRWRQYTPYFNDGEPCVFSAYGFGIDLGLRGEDEDGRDYPYGEYEDDFFEAWSLWSTYREPSERLKPFVEDKELESAFRAVESGIEGGHYDNVLLSRFGDHAQVTVRADTITVEYYDHE